MPTHRELVSAQQQSPLTTKTSSLPRPAAVIKLPETVTTAEYVETLKAPSQSSPQTPPLPSLELPPMPSARIPEPSREPTLPAVVISDKITPLAVPPPPPDPIIPSSGVTAAKKPLNLWLIQIEQTDGKDVVRATIGKRAGIKITCDRVDLQTVNDFFQAQGNVVLSGNDLQCRCEKLTIRLNEDCLFLEGKAHVGLLSPKADVASQSPLVELKGDQFSLRWPDLRIETGTSQPPSGEVLPEPKVVPDKPQTPR
jgi:hypothetical protein